MICVASLPAKATAAPLRCLIGQVNAPSGRVYEVRWDAGTLEVDVSGPHGDVAARRGRNDRRPCPVVREALTRAEAAVRDR